MSEHIIIVDSSKIREGKLESLSAAMKELTEFVKANEPRIIAYNVYLNKDDTTITVFQVHPGSESAEFHMEVAGPAFSKFVDFIWMLRIDIYGNPSHSLLERMKLKAQMLGSGKIEVHKLHAGFTRFEIENLKKG